MEKISACDYVIEQKPPKIFELKRTSKKLVEALKTANVIGQEASASPWTEINAGADKPHFMRILKWSKEISVADLHFPGKRLYPNHQHHY